MNETATTLAGHDTPVDFSGGRGEIARIAIVNLLLTVVTLGIYRFWAKTRLRQFYWDNISIGGDAIEYTGRGVELFLGFLIAMVVLAILSVGIGVIQFYLAFGNPGAAEAINVAVYIVVFWLYGYAVYRARRYRLTRTLWRGIRFGQDGSPARYAWRRFGLTILLVLSLGIARPWVDVALRRYEMTHTRFGFSRFDYAGRGRDLFRYWWPVLPPLAAIVAGVLLVAFQFIEVARSPAVAGGDRQAMEAALDVSLGTPLSAAAYGLIGVGAIGYALLGTRYRVASLRYLFAVSGLRDVTGRSRARTGRVMLYAASSIGLIALAMAIGFALAVPLGGFGFVLVGLAFLSSGIVMQIFFTFPLVRHVAATIVTTDLAALDDIVQATRDDPRFGEGLLDALDFDMGVV